MKRVLALFSVTALLLVSLAGCGKDTAVTGSVIGGSRGTNATANAQLRGNSRSATGTVSTPGTLLDGDEQYRRMLANAHVHDTDGFLLDGENAQYVTW